MTVERQNVTNEKIWLVHRFSKPGNIKITLSQGVGVGFSYPSIEHFLILIKEKAGLEANILDLGEKGELEEWRPQIPYNSSLVTRWFRSPMMKQAM